jgi:hypothetical protein
MRTGSEYMIGAIMTAAASGLVLAGYVAQRGLAPDVERVAGRMWADVTHENFAQCPRKHGVKFWMGCTDLAPPANGGSS